MPADAEFAARPALAAAMITRAVTAGAPGRWAAGDEVYGSGPGLRAGIAGHGLGFVLAVAEDHPVPAAAGNRRAAGLAVCLPPRSWQRRPAGDGAKGPRLYDWALIETTGPALPAGGQGSSWLLAGRPVPASRGIKPECACYRARASRPAPLLTLVQVAGIGWKTGESFAGSQELTAPASIRSGPGPPGCAGPSSRCSPAPSCRP